MKNLNLLAVALLTTFTLSAQAGEEQTTAKTTLSASSYGQHMAYEKACKDIEGVKLESKNKKEAVRKHIAEGGNKSEFKSTVKSYEQSTEKTLAQLDSIELAKSCKDYSGV